MVAHGEQHSALDKQKPQGDSRNDGAKSVGGNMAIFPKGLDPVQAYPDDGQAKAVVTVFSKRP